MSFTAAATDRITVGDCDGFGRFASLEPPGSKCVGGPIGVGCVAMVGKAVDFQWRRISRSCRNSARVAMCRNSQALLLPPGNSMATARIDVRYG